MVERKPPQADFSFSPVSPTVQDTVEFTDRSHDLDGRIVSWLWEFGDGTTSTERNPTHRYTEKGSFTVKLTVTDDDGLTATKEAKVEVVNVPPKASFAFSPKEPYAGQEVSLDASGSEDPDGKIVGYSWDFGDGETTEGIEVKHVFEKPGTYTVNLTVTDEDGAKATHKEEVVVLSLPQPPPRFKEQWALVVGISDYRDQNILDLKYPEEDAKAFYDFLTSPDGGGFPRDHVRLLLGEEATLREMLKGLAWLRDSSTEDDLVVFYFAGHGAFVQDRNGDEEDGVDECLLPFDADPDSLSETTLLDDELGNWVNGLSTKAVVLILDAAYGGGFELPQGVSIAPGGETGLAWENEELGHGVLTYFLLRGLGVEGEPEADLDADGVVTVGELRNYLKQKVPAFLEETEGQAQEPQVTILGMPENQPFLCIRGKVPQAPHAGFSFSPASPTVLDTVLFTNNSHDPDGNIVSWSWDFGDGTTSTERNPRHRYTRKGTFTVKLTVTDDEGLKDTKEVEIQVVNVPPEASFTFGPEEPYAGQEVSFDASGSEDPDGEIVKYSWDFDGDGVIDAEGVRV
ncbi:MAG: hypothetical protein DRJ45_09675, partial [Thermoprotei archaeon]